ncbi:hypothetical protein [Nocardioides sp.]|uniref:hypothetical protein n=1 Tax=Nocardioides sp. TaxID=35761 RepID=UPI003519352E
MCPPHLRHVHDLPAPGPVAHGALAAMLRLYAATVDVRPADPRRSLAADFGARYGPRDPDDVGYQRRRPTAAHEAQDGATRPG